MSFAQRVFPWQTHLHDDGLKILTIETMGKEACIRALCILLYIARWRLDSWQEARENSDGASKGLGRQEQGYWDRKPEARVLVESTHWACSGKNLSLAEPYFNTVKVSG